MDRVSAQTVIMPIQDKDRMPYAATTGRGVAAVMVIAGLCLICEAIVDGAEFGFWGQPGWRRVAIEYGGFWVGLLGNWRPNFPGQWLTMFLTHAFLHAGFWHFTTNMVTLALVAQPVAQRLGQIRFVVLYMGAAVGGGIGYALILPEAAPMVGASGALFGLFGALCAWDYETRSGAGRAAFVAWIATILIVLNGVQWWVNGGLLAWQAHVAGFVAGWLLGQVLEPRQDGVSSS